MCAVTVAEKAISSGVSRRTPGSERERGHGPAALGYRPALDGLRALAVAAVVAYHLGYGWARGGFLGVDVFFVLSGFLITTLLLDDHQRHGRLRLGRFWGRRARRLLPALAVVLVAVSLAVRFLAPDQGWRIRGDLLAAAAYVSNWRLVFTHQSYFQAMGRPPLLQHLWSLAVEEQFYLLWPLVMAVGLRRTNRLRLAAGALMVALGSTILMAGLFHPGADPSRVYYGTDTRLAALLVGAALACLWPRNSARRLARLDPGQSRRRAVRATLDVAGLAALGGLVLCVARLDEFQPRLYRGGFLAVALLAAVVVGLGAVRPPSLVARLLATRPLVWLGKRSYAVYLWFWPVFMLTRPYADVSFDGPPLLALRLGLTVGLAAASYRLVEQPIRNGALQRLPSTVADAWRRLPLRWPPRRPVGWALVVVLACAGVATGVVLQGRHGPRPVLVSAAAADAHARADAATTTAAPATTAAPTTTLAPPPPPPPAPVAAEPPPPSDVVHARVTAIGESVLLEAKDALAARVDGLLVDAAIGRQMTASIAAARALRDQGKLGGEVLVQVGNNGPITAAQFDKLVEALKGAQRVVVVNVKVPRPWEGSNNEVLAKGVARTPNAVLVDWHRLGSSHPQAFTKDGVHMTPAGVRLFVSLVAAAL